MTEIYSDDSVQILIHETLDSRNRERYQIKINLKYVDGPEESLGSINLNFGTGLSKAELSQLANKIQEILQ